jgi:hypothetical protein
LEIHARFIVDAAIGDPDHLVLAPQIARDPQGEEGGGGDGGIVRARRIPPGEGGLREPAQLLHPGESVYTNRGPPAVSRRARPDGPHPGRKAGYQRICQWLARFGYLVLGFDPMGQGERTYYPGRTPSRSRWRPSGPGKREAGTSGTSGSRPPPGS